MTENDYIKISDRIRKYKYGEQIVRKLNLFSTSVVYIIYIGFNLGHQNTKNS